MGVQVGMGAGSGSASLGTDVEASTASRGDRCFSLPHLHAPMVYTTHPLSGCIK